MKKNIIYIVLALVIGLLGGYLLFGGGSSSSDNHVHQDEAAADQMWTCSMHPQIMQPEPGDCPICGMNLIPAEPVGEGLALKEIKMTTNAMALAKIHRLGLDKNLKRQETSMMLPGKIILKKEAKALQSGNFEG